MESFKTSYPDNYKLGSSLFKYFKHCCDLVPEEEECKKLRCENEAFSQDCCNYYLESENIGRYKQNAELCCNDITISSSYP